MIATVELPKIPECHILDSDTNLEPGIYRDIARTSVVVVDAMKRKVMFEGGKLKTMWGCNKWYTKLPDGTTLTVSMDGGDVRCVVRRPEEGSHLQVHTGMLVGKVCGTPAGRGIPPSSHWNARREVPIVVPARDDRERSRKPHGDTDREGNRIQGVVPPPAGQRHDHDCLTHDSNPIGSRMSANRPALEFNPDNLDQVLAKPWLLLHPTLRTPLIECWLNNIHVDGLRETCMPLAMAMRFLYRSVLRESNHKTAFNVVIEALDNSEEGLPVQETIDSIITYNYAHYFRKEPVPAPSKPSTAP